MTARRIQIPFPIGLSRGRSKVAGIAGCVNCYVEPVKNEGRTQIAIYPFPGKTRFATIGGGSVRGQLDFAGYHAAIVGTRLYTIDSLGVATDRGEVEGADRVDVDYNGAQLFIAGLIKSYYYDAGAETFAEVADADFRGASSCCSLNGFTLTSVPNSDRFQWFALRDASSVNGLDFATGESNGDINVALRVANKDLHIFGEKTTEFFYHSGNPNQQFESKGVPPLEIGCLARDSVVLMDTGFNWVGRDGKSGGIGVYRMAGGYTAKKISSPAVDRFLEEFPQDSVDEIHAYGVQFHAHQFYCLHLPGVVSLYYDQATNEWGYLKSGTYALNADPTGGHDSVTFAVNGGKRIVGASDGHLYELDASSNTDSGEPLVREIICSQISAGSDHGAILHRFGIDCEVGVGVGAQDPQIMAALSKDGGHNWKTLTPRSLGQAGRYKTDVFWTRQGQFDDLIAKMRVTDDVFFGAFSAYADVEPLA